MYEVGYRENGYVWDGHNWVPEEQYDKARAEEQSPYQVGQRANGHFWNGSEWIPERGQVPSQQGELTKAVFGVNRREATARIICPYCQNPGQVITHRGRAGMTGRRVTVAKCTNCRTQWTIT